MKQESITIISKRMKKKIRITDILYIIKSEYLSLIHLIDGDILQTITPIYELKEMLGDDCIEVKKGCIVSVSAITNVKDKIYLCNGEAIDFTVRRRKAVRLEWQEKQKLMIDEINGQNPPRTDEEYHKYYEICDKFPFAFTDIEMVFNEKRHAVDWIFRYGNEALAELDPNRPELPEDVIEQININIKYDGYIKRQMKQVEQFKKMEEKKIPENINYDEIQSLRIEAKQKLNLYRPINIGQASRISGVSPADISVLLVYLGHK